MKAIKSLSVIAISGALCLAATSAHAIRINIQDKGVRGGSYVEHYEGTCTSSKHSGDKWVVRFEGKRGWFFQGPQGEGREQIKRVDWEEKAKELCGESRGGRFTLG